MGKDHPYNVLAKIAFIIPEPKPSGWVDHVWFVVIGIACVERRYIRTLESGKNPSEISL